MTTARQRLRQALNRSWQLAGSVSIRTKILGIVLTMMVVLGTVITIWVRKALANELQEHLLEESASVANSIAASATDLILVNDLYGLHQLLQSTIANYPDVRYAFILDSDGAVIAHTFGEGFPSGLVEANPCDPCLEFVTTSFWSDEGRIWDTAAPIFSGKAGMTRVGLSEFSMQSTLSRVTLQLIGITSIVSLLGTLAAVFLTWILTRPIFSLVSAAQAVGKGDLSQRVTKWADDEIGTLEEAFNEMVADLASAEQAREERDRVRSQLLERVISAQEEERKRIARELHDEAGQSLTTLMVGLRTLMELCPDSQLLAQAAELRKVASETLDSIRNMAWELRPSVLDDLGLEAALARYVADFRQRHGLAVDYAVLGLEENRLPAPVETALYRIVQESLTNIVRHAQTDAASVTLELRQGSVRVLVEDGGTGFNTDATQASREHLGLFGMQERVELLGGNFLIESEAGKGTSIIADIPVEPIPPAVVTFAADDALRVVSSREDPNG